MPSPLAMSWVLSTISGYGIYGLQIALQYLRRGGNIRDIILTNKATLVSLSPLEQARVDPCLLLSEKIHDFMKKNPDETLFFKHAALHASGNDFCGYAGQERVRGTPNVSCAAIEYPILSEHGRKVAKTYDFFIAISRWNEAFLKSQNLGPVYLCHQGIDPALFHPAPGSGLYKNRFVIFSGGKFEFRKGQDIVVAAFKRFYEKHPDALLVTCWQSLFEADAASFESAGHCASVPKLRANGNGIDITPWLLGQGLPEGSFVDIDFTHNPLMPVVLRDCHMAVFPNRCEGGTNLVAMEAMACGVPTYVSYNSGQKDLVDFIGCGAFRTQAGVRGAPAVKSTEGWGETNVDEIVAAMEKVYADYENSRRDALIVAKKMQEDWSWSDLNEKLLKIVCDGER